MSAALRNVFTSELILLLSQIITSAETFTFFWTSCLILPVEILFSVLFSSQQANIYICLYFYPLLRVLFQETSPTSDPMLYHSSVSHKTQIPYSIQVSYRQMPKFWSGFQMCCLLNFYFSSVLMIWKIENRKLPMVLLMRHLGQIASKVIIPLSLCFSLILNKPCDYFIFKKESKTEKPNSTFYAIRNGNP